MSNLAFNAPNGQIHFGEPPSGVIGLLAIDGNVRFGSATVAVSVCVRADEFHGLHEHT